MKRFSLLIRRAHLYLGLFCLPWVIMYGVTSIAFNHREWFTEPAGMYRANTDHWTLEGEWDCDVEVPPQGEIPRELTAQLVEIAGMDAKAFGGYRVGGDEVNVYFPSFHELNRLVYKFREGRLLLYSREPVLQATMTGMHARAGYQHDGILNDVWAVMVDVSAIGFVLWVLSGIYIWWQAPTLRLWGGVALGAGAVVFVAFLVLL